MQTITINESSASLRRIPFACELPAARNETQRIDLGDFGVGDSFTLTYSGQTTAAILYDASTTTVASSIDAKLEALTNIGAGAITVTYVSAALYDVVFAGALASLDVALLTITPTTFTPGTITQRQHGGVDAAPARGLTFAAADIQISKNGATAVNSAGSVVEVGNGLYYYQATAGEVDTSGFLSLAIVHADTAVAFPTVQIVASSTADGYTVLATGTAQSGTSTTMRLATSETTTSSYYVPVLAVITSGTGAKQARISYDYNGATKDLYVEPAWTTPPDSTSAYALLATAPLLAAVLRANHDDIGTFGEVSTIAAVAAEVRDTITDDGVPFSGANIASIASRLPTALVGGRMSSDAVAISGSTTAADKFESHAAAVLQAVIDAGSGTTAVILNATTGIDGGAPSASNDVYKNRVLVITSGPAAGQATSISAYTGLSRTLTVTALTTAPASGNTAVIV